MVSAGKNVDLLLPVLSTYLGHVFITGTYWYLTCTPEQQRQNDWRGDGKEATTQKTDLGTLVQAFFCKRLISQRRASPHTIASYRDTFRLLLAFVQKRLSRPPSQLELKDISPSLISDFLDHLEATRTNRARTRNLRLAAIRSFFRFAALEAPDHGGVIQRVLAIPNKRCQRPLIGFLTRAEIEALLAAVDCRTWVGRRDYALLLVAMQTGLRLSELTTVRREDVSLGPGAHIHCVGKGRKERGTPLTKLARRVLQAWMKESWPNESAFLFPSFSDGRLSADAVQDLENKHGGSSSPEVSFACQKASYTACATSHRGHGITASCRSIYDCTLVGTRIRRNHPNLSQRQSSAKGRNPGQDQSR